MANDFKINSHDFINFKEFIEKEFNENCFIIDTPKKNILFHHFGPKKKRRGVVINNSEMISLNFSLIYSHFPEFLAFICFINKDKKMHLPDVLHYLSSKEHADNSILFSKQVLHINFLRFFERLLFSNLFKQIWKGEYLNRVFVFKKKNKLFYVGMFQIFDISKIIYHNTLMKSKIIAKEKDRTTFRLSFLVDINSVIKEMYKKIR